MIKFFFPLMLIFTFSAQASVICRPVNSSNTAYSGDIGLTKSQQVVCRPDGSVAYASLSIAVSKAGSYSAVMISTEDCRIQGQMLRDKIAGFEWTPNRNKFVQSTLYTALAKAFVVGNKTMVKPTDEECRSPAATRGSVGSLIQLLLDIR